MGLRRFVLIAVGLALALLSGCGDNGYRGPKVATMLTGGPPAAQNAPMSDEDKFRVFESCMKDKGAEINKNPDSGMPSEEMMQKMNEAAEACREFLPNAGAPPPLDPKQLDEARKQAQCLRDHGIDAKDPTNDRPYVDFGGNLESEQSRKAMEDCMGMPKVEVAEPGR